MNIQQSNNQSFKASVKIDYKQLRGLGQKAVLAAEEAKPFLEKKANNLSFFITRGYIFNPNAKDLETASDMFIPQKSILVEGVRKNVGAKETIKNIFYMNPKATKSTQAFSKNAICRAANKVVVEVNTQSPKTILAKVKDVLTYSSDAGATL